MLISHLLAFSDSPLVNLLTLSNIKGVTSLPLMLLSLKRERNFTCTCTVHLLCFR